MKVNKLISKGLALGFLLNSASILSYASTEIPNRYQTLEGEYITIDDSTKGNLEEIEIFGNTVQDLDNLEDIQNVGDLYVDDEGNPILDNQGRKQYKIDVLTNNDWIGMSDIQIRSSAKRYSFNEFEVVASNSWNSEVNFYVDSDNLPLNSQISVKIKVLENTLSNGCNNSTLNFGWNIVDFNLPNFNYSSNEWQEISFITTRKSSLNKIRIYSLSISDKATEGRLRAKIEVDVKSNNNLRKLNTILIPCQLQKIGNISDKLYWDKERGKYVIEKNIAEHKFAGGEGWRRDMIFSSYATYKINSSVFYKKPILGNTYPAVTTKSAGVTKTELPKIYLVPTSCAGDTENYAFFFNLSHNEIGYDNLDRENFNDTLADKWVRNNTPIAYYATSNPDVIETNITSKFKIPTYDGKTHIYVNSENVINPTLKVTIDRLPQIAKEAIESAKTNNTDYNISLARMYINMLSESLYKDQLQEQLNNLFSSDTVLEKKNATANLDLYIKSENILQMSLDTNSITFDDFSGVEDMVKENALNISINSSLPYSLNAYLPTEIQNSDKSTTMDKSILNIKENNESVYQTFSNINEKVVLKDNNPAGNNINHGIDIKLKGNIAHQKDVYKTTIKFEAEQK